MGLLLSSIFGSSEDLNSSQFLGMLKWYSFHILSLLVALFRNQYTNVQLFNICIFTSSISGLMTRAIAESIFRQEEERSALRALQNKCSVTSLQFLECILTFPEINLSRPLYAVIRYKCLQRSWPRWKTGDLPTSLFIIICLRPIWEQWRLPMIISIWLSSSNEHLPETNLRGDQWRLPSGFKRNKPLCSRIHSRIGRGLVSQQDNA